MVSTTTCSVYTKFKHNPIKEVRTTIKASLHSMAWLWDDKHSKKPHNYSQAFTDTALLTTC